MLMGDFNFDNKSESENIDEKYKDIWVDMNDMTMNGGHTMKKNKQWPAWRPDKMVLKSVNGLW